jgi:hypothetical protein
MEEFTCGKGLAESSALPRNLSNLLAAMAHVLEDHMQALDLNDANAKQEYDAYNSLVQKNREIVTRLTAVTDEMVGYRGLPMGRHDEERMLQPETLHAFETFVERKKVLSSYLQETLEEDQQMLDQMHGIS